jgi:septal ring factor EnvC (AmiA/AmiB activator)
MFDSVRGRVLGVSAAALIAIALPHAGARAQDLSLPDMSNICAQIAKASESAIKDFEARLAKDLARYRANDDSNPMNALQGSLREIRNRIAAEQALIKDVEAQIAELRHPAGASAFDSRIKEQERLIAEVQAKRLAVHSGSDGKPGIDRLQELIAEIDRRIAAKGFVNGAEEAAAKADRAGHVTALQARLAEKAGLATEFGALRDELARLKRERDKLNPQPDKLKNLEAQLAEANKRLQKHRADEDDLRDKQDKLRKDITMVTLGEAEIRGCISDRRRVLAAATQPTPPSKPDDPKTPGTPPPASAASATFTLGGTWSGQCNGSFAVSGRFTINAASGKINGTYNGGDSGAIGGQVNGSGQLSASGAGGGGGRSVRWTGSVTQTTSGWSGAGRWTSSGESLACDGSWKSQ